MAHPAALTTLLLLALGAALPDPASFVFEPESRIWIEGTSSLHDWTCDVEQFAGTLEAEATGASLADLTSTSVTVPVQAIDCDNGTMNGKLRKALDSDEHPLVRFTLTSGTVDGDDTDGWFDIAAAGRLSIAGETKPVRLAVRGKSLGGARFRLTGQADLRMTDFGIDPPTALLGTLRTGDEVTVHFDATVSR